MALVLRDPFQDLTRMFNRVPFTAWPYEAQQRDTEQLQWLEQLALDVFDQNGNLVVKAAIPGVKPDDVDITIDDGVLTILATTTEEKDIKQDDYYMREYHAGTVKRSVRLPQDVMADQATSTFENGMLRLVIPRKPETRPRKIKVTPQ